jgi:hypothetical protein
MSPADLNKYKGAQAIIAGTAEVFIAVPPETDLPNDDEIAKVVGHAFTDAFSREMKIRANVASVTAYHKGVAQMTVDDVRTRSVLVSYEIDVEDGGSFQEKLAQEGNKIHTRCIKEITKDESSWLSKTELTMWNKLSCSYYKEYAGESFPEGTRLYQEFGEKHGVQLSTEPYFNKAEDE